MSAYLIHWSQTSRDHAELAARDEGVTGLHGTTRVESEAELVGFLLNLPGDGTFVVRALSELQEGAHP